MSGGNSANSSWTIVSPEETVAETVRPLEEQTKHHVQVCEPSNQPPEGADCTSSLSVDNHQDAEERKADPSDDSITDRPPSSVIDAPVPVGEVQSEVAPDNPNQDAFSDSLSHVTPSPDEPSGSPMSAETLGGAELTQQEERHDGTREEDLKQEGLESDLLSKHPDSSEQPGSDEERAKDTESERKRLLASLERIGRIDEEEEGEEEEFQLPRQREDDNMFSLNRCILGAVILVALGTILFSGVFMDLDEESVYSTRELSDPEEPGRQEWLHPEALPPPADAENSELLTKLAKEDQQISMLQAQLEAQKEQLQAAEGQAAEGEMTRMRWQEENSRLKSEVASLPVLEKENEMLRKELETLPTLQHELETLRSAVSKLTVPPSGQPADRKQNGKRGKEEKDKHDMGENKESKKNEWKARKESGRTERKRAEGEKRQHGKYDDVKEGEGKHKEEKDWKRESRGEEGKTWKERDVKKVQAEKMERKEWKKGKHEKQWRGEGEKEWRKDEGERHKVMDKWKQKGKNGFEGHGKDKTWKSNNGEKGKGGERKHVEDAKKHAGKTDDGKQWSHHGKGDKDRRKNGDGQKRKEDSGELKGDKSNWHKHKIAGHHREENMWAERKTSPPGQQQSAADSTDYWTQQRKRLHRKPKQPQHCHSQEACAQAEGLHPVSFPHFESILHAYLAKAEQAGVDSSKRDQLRKLTSEFFQDGVFVHDRVNFRKFVKDVSDILEDMVEGDGEEDSDLEDEMEAFGREALEKFLVVGGGEQRKGEWRKENARASG
ncbi:pre-B-cell leukemia homeobox interacting protein 1b isoform X1 [Hippocampus comes]|uniref:Pre-B-cell leukemia homeobox interacting protein 1b n=1 Tax=Hippocampus comes TaxID=109280 RepID=A0A3Q2YTS5_HIPCM|nr:PREDICTED: pre-B-cell leukemia transcription factor-interacting protein 1 isoform X1 [Hippocampus comes]XP_019734196.1 PREDICTED: pre-B-cell leukemia transcription factor-interacting protein 1 isoform X1 [Hippocampus comes]